ncbi:MAG: Por secretion system protein, partial [Duncaniella sp.]|nr:Por secretion system protein [Duncaniella sp.]
MKHTLLSLAVLALSAGMAQGAVQTETLDRGVVAVKTANSVFVSWRSLPTDDPKVVFDVYRDGAKVNATPLAAGTNFNDPDGTVNSKYVVKALTNDAVTETSKECSVEPDVYKRIKLVRPADGTTPAGETYSYSPNDCSIGDVDGDGQMEIFVKWDPSNQKDNSQNGYTGNVYIDCYTLEGTQLWRIDLGRNIRAGAHYTQFMVYDFDGDGKAEMIVKTAPGTIDGQGKAVLMGDDKVTDDYRGTSGSHTTGVIMAGPEYLTVFNGQTGAEINTIAYNP